MTDITYSGIVSRLGKLAGPIMVGQIGVVLVSFADTFMIGHYGVHELAAASFVNNVTMILVLAGLGFSLGLTPLISNAESQGNRGVAGAYLRQGLKASAMLSALVAAILLVLYLNLGRMGQPEELLPLIRPYFTIVSVSILTTFFFNAFKQFTDGIMRPSVSMVMIIAGNAMNIIGNYLLIYGKCGLPELGLQGAGISTLVARAFTVAGMAAYFFMSRSTREYRKGFFSRGSGHGMLSEIARLGAPISGQMAMETASFSVIVIIVGWLGTNALAAHQVMSTIAQICYMMYIAVGSAGAILISSFNGRGMVREVDMTARASYLMTLALTAVCLGIVLTSVGNLTSLFTDSPEVRDLAMTLILPFALYQIGDGMQICFSNALRGIQQVRPILPIAFVSYILISIPASYLLGIMAGFGLKGIWFGYPISLTMAGLLYLAMFRNRQRKAAAPFMPETTTEKNCEK